MRKLSEETKAKISKALKGIKRSDKFKKKMSESMKGKNKGKTAWNKGLKTPDNVKEKQAEARRKYYENHINVRKGKHHSLETRRKLSIASTERAKQGNLSRIEYDGMKFDSHWELYFYKYCLRNGIQVERSVVCELPSGHHYVVDFRINGNQLVEIKGPQFFNNKGELINPFQNPNKIQDEHSKEKQQFWEEHGVIIIKDIKPFI